MNIHVPAKKTGYIVNEKEGIYYYIQYWNKNFSDIFGVYNTDPKISRIILVFIIPIIKFLMHFWYL